MEKGIKMTPREVEKIVILTGAGKSLVEISEEINRSRGTVAAYIRAIRQAMQGTFVHQSASGVRYELIEPYIRKDGKARAAEKEALEKEVQLINRPESQTAPDGSTVLDAKNALLIANEIESHTPLDIITRLMRVDLPTLNRMKGYIGLLKTGANDEAVSWHKREVFLPEVFDALESQFNFFPKERTQEDVEADFRKEILSSIELTNDFLNSIDDLLRKLVKAFVHEAA